MEYSHQQELTNRSDDSLGVGRLYECVFCKRGFNTAQALGGHMNIHRRDKVKKNKSSSTYNQEEEEKKHHQRFSSYDQNIMPASSSSYYNHDHFVYDHKPRSTNNPKRFQGSTSYFRDDQRDQKDDLDLELRLGL
ncbi:hypothetical protein CASFOL_035527 [Castilleja foliolosa]|uniref:C2H2-type domain-containing protein n=1 Tax=Castilleja foliolosa TaxID=1961234 RepID=A0ABD3BT41_9LAMI